jgi:hypothetical protein
MGVAGRWFRASLALMICCAAAGCTASLSGGPQRVFTAKENWTAARATLADIERRYYGICDSQPSSSCNPSPDLGERQSLRNEYIGESLQAIDAQFAPYEEGLIRDRQLAGFGAATTALSLNTAGTLAPGSAPLLSGLAGLATGIEGKYESEVLLAKTIDIIKGQMDASRAAVAASILKKLNLSVIDYPLPISKSDLEDYYRAGTFSTGLQKAATDAGQSASQAEADKSTAIEFKYTADTNSDLLRDYLLAGGFKELEQRRTRLEAIRVKVGCPYELTAIFNNPNALACTKNMVTEARSEGLSL